MGWDVIDFKIILIVAWRRDLEKGAVMEAGRPVRRLLR